MTRRSRHAGAAHLPRRCCSPSSPASSSGRRRRASGAVAARPRDLGADLRDGGHRLRLPRRAARAAAAGGDGAGLGRGASSSAAARDGHFHAELEVNGAPVRFIVDTGASDIVLSRARRASGSASTRTALAFLGRGAAPPTARSRPRRSGSAPCGSATSPTPACRRASPGRARRVAARHVLSRPLRLDRDLGRPRLTLPAGGSAARATSAWSRLPGTANHDRGAAKAITAPAFCTHRPCSCAQYFAGSPAAVTARQSVRAASTARSSWPSKIRQVRSKPAISAGVGAGAVDQHQHLGAVRDSPRRASGRPAAARRGRRPRCRAAGRRRRGRSRASSSSAAMPGLRAAAQHHPPAARQRASPAAPAGSPRAAIAVSW